MTKYQENIPVITTNSEVILNDGVIPIQPNGCIVDITPSLSGVNITLSGSFSKPTPL